MNPTNSAGTAALAAVLNQTQAPVSKKAEPTQQEKTIAGLFADKLGNNPALLVNGALVGAACANPVAAVAGLTVGTLAGQAGLDVTGPINMATEAYKEFSYAGKAAAALTTFVAAGALTLATNSPAAPIVLVTVAYSAYNASNAVNAVAVR